MKTVIGINLVIATLALSVITAGCKGYEDEELPVTAAASTSVVPGVVNDALGFKVEIPSSNNYTYNVHQNASTSECSTTTGTVAAPTTIDCLVEAKEFDLYFNGVTLAYNVPRTMCTYFGLMPYYYYSWEPGTGFAGTVEIEVNAFGDVYFIAPGSNVGGNTAAGVANGVSQGTANPAGYAGVSALSGMTPVCEYDHSLDTNPGPNCCAGNYSLRIHTQEADGDWTSALTNASWGGEHSSCLSGPAMETQTIAANGYPGQTVSYVQNTGTSGSYTVAAPISSSHSSNIPVANFLTNIFTTAARATATTAGAATNTSPFYYFTCYDRTFEILSQIRVAVREWNVDSDFTASAATAIDDTSAVPDTSGAEPSGGNYNDMADLDDIENGDATTVPVIPNQDYPALLE